MIRSGDQVIRRHLPAAARGGGEARKVVVAKEEEVVRDGRAKLLIWLASKGSLPWQSTYYGAALADAAPDTARPEDYKPGGTAVARDLAFYPTPAEAVAILLDGLPVKPGDRVLEPQAGIGNIVRPLLARGALVDAVEIHPGRADALHGMAHPRLNVLCENFLTRRPDPVYDLVVMNPPFAGTHWMKHVRHAWDFLKPIVCQVFLAFRQISDPNGL